MTLRNVNGLRSLILRVDNLSVGGNHNGRLSWIGYKWMQRQKSAEVARLWLETLASSDTPNSDRL